MTKRAAIRQADLNRALKAAAKLGYEVRVEGDIIRLLPVAANSPSDGAAEMARRMKEAFGE